MKMNLTKYILSTVCLLWQFVPTASAQVFATDNDDNLSAVSQASAPVQNKTTSSNWGKFYNQQQTQNNNENAVQDKVEKNNDAFQFQPPAKQEVLNPEDYIYKDVPQVDRPTLDGVARGRTSIIAITNDTRQKAEGYIYLFYSDFSVSSLMSGSTTCDVKFQIVTTLDRKLNSLAVRLKWDRMETPLNFIEVNPNQQYEFTYTLLGDGCYSMDKIPNIVINRCRVKGMTQEECARRVRWIRKM